MRLSIHVALDFLITIALVTTLGAQAPVRGPERQQTPMPGPAGPRTPPRDPGASPVPAVDGTATLRGQIVAADTGTPIRRAQVRVSSGGARGARLATTDASGRFEFRNLAAGRYTLSASKGGFVTLQYGQRRPGESGTPLEVADQQTIDKLVIGLPRGSVISGRITDEFGEPVVNAGVSAMQYNYVNGRQRLQPAGARDTTDDQGQYRLFGLSPGDYIVSATLRTNEVTDAIEAPSGYAPTYYPGTPSPAEAQRVRLGLQQENSAVSFGLTATRLVRVSGQVMTAIGGAASGGMVTLSNDDGVSVVGAGDDAYQRCRRVPVVERRAGTLPPAGALGFARRGQLRAYDARGRRRGHQRPDVGDRTRRKVERRRRHRHRRAAADRRQRCPGGRTPRVTRRCAAGGTWQS